MKKINVALFVPHEGCPNQCSFCNQRSISGQQQAPTPEEVSEICRESLEELSRMTEANNQLILEREAEYERRAKREGLTMAKIRGMNGDELMDLTLLDSNIILYVSSLEEELRHLKQADTNIRNAQLAFFGGSFTAIERGYMESLLKAANAFVGEKGFAGIRISTRPDAIDKEMLELLQKYHVIAIELGAQSMDDEVLEANNRGHTAEDVRRASALIKEHGIELGLQMMTGLYKSTPKKDKFTAVELAKLEPDTMRIYPTILIRSTHLEKLYEQGLYHPQKLPEAVNLCVKLLEFFNEKNIPVIRLGLQSSPELEKDMIAGPYHPAFSEICEGDILFRKVIKELKNMEEKRHAKYLKEVERLEKLERFKQAEQFKESHRIELLYESEKPKKVTLEISPRSVSKMVGHNKRNIMRFNKMGYAIKIRQIPELNEDEVGVFMENYGQILLS